MKESWDRPSDQNAEISSEIENAGSQRKSLLGVNEYAKTRSRYDLASVRATLEFDDMGCQFCDGWCKIHGGRIRRGPTRMLVRQY
jgi:hypothetical protein